MRRCLVRRIARSPLLAPRVQIHSRLRLLSISPQDVGAIPDSPLDEQPRQVYVPRCTIKVQSVAPRMLESGDGERVPRGNPASRASPDVETESLSKIRVSFDIRLACVFRGHVCRMVNRKRSPPNAVNYPGSLPGSQEVADEKAQGRAFGRREQRLSNRTNRRGETCCAR